VLGFSAIADSPIADIREDQYLVLTSQTLSLTLNSAAATAAANAAASSQNLVTTLNSLTIQAAANYALQSQNLALTLNSVTASAAVNLTATSQSLALSQNDVLISVQPPTFDSQSLTLSLNSVAIATEVDALLSSQSLALTLNSVTASAAVNLTADSQALSLTLNSVTASAAVNLTAASQSLTLTQNHVLNSTDQTVGVTGFSIASTLNSFRSFWLDVFTVQIPEIPYDDASIASNPICYTPPAPTTETSIQGNWNEITLDAVVYGQDCSIGSQPICVGVNYTNTELLVVAVNGAGAITQIAIKHTSLYDEVPSNPVSVVATNGGSGATFNIAYTLNVAVVVDIANAGSGYVVGDTLFVLGGIGYNLPSTGKYPASPWNSITTTQNSNWTNIPT
jgi:hypothetical protein